MSERIYLDNAAATAPDTRVLDTMQACWHDTYGNAGALHKEGIAAHRMIEAARTTVAHILQARPEDLVFTSGGTEANNLAILGAIEERVQHGTAYKDLHVVTSTIEHSSVLDCMRTLEERGTPVSYVPVDSSGKLRLDKLRQVLRPTTVLVSIILAHNEVGIIQDTRNIARAIRAYSKQHDMPQPIFHTDASQAPTWMPVALSHLAVDILTLDAQKMYGPKGSGCLARTKDVALAPILYGGGQEFHLRPGTPPTPLILGFAKALALVEEERASYVDTIRGMRDQFIAKVIDALPYAVLNGPRGGNRIANNINLSFPGLDAEQMVIALDAKGIACSTRSACLFDERPGSYVVRALGAPENIATSAVRFTLSRHTTAHECSSAAQTVIDVVRALKEQGT